MIKLATLLRRLEGSRAVAPQASAVARRRSADGRRTWRGHLAKGRRAFATPDVRRAQAAVREVLEGRGLFVGRGNFGAAYRAVVNGVPYLVKLGSRRTLHTRSPGDLYPKRGQWSQGGRRFKTMREELLHEVGVANELAALGHRVVPEAVYAEHKGKPALVREWGEIPAHVTPEEYDALSRALYAVVKDGWHVDDHLLVGRRADGTLFVVDLSSWRPQTGDPNDTSWNSSASIARDDLFSWLRSFSSEQPWAVIPGERFTPGVPSVVELEHARKRLRETLAERDEDDDGFMVKQKRKMVAQIEARRASVGLRG